MFPCLNMLEPSSPSSNPISISQPACFSYRPKPKTPSPYPAGASLSASTPSFRSFPATSRPSGFSLCWFPKAVGDGVSLQPSARSRSARSFKGPSWRGSRTTPVLLSWILSSRLGGTGDMVAWFEDQKWESLPPNHWIGAPENANPIINNLDVT